MDRDCEFLEQEKIMDYSLLVGMHFIDNREKLLTEGWMENPEHFTSFLIYKKKTPWPFLSMVVFYLTRQIVWLKVALTMKSSTTYQNLVFQGEIQIGFLLIQTGN